MNPAFVKMIVTEVLNELESGKPKIITVHCSRSFNEQDARKELSKKWHVIDFTQIGEIPAEVQHAVFLQVNQDLLVKSVLGITDTKESSLFSEFMLRDYRLYFVLDSFLQKILTKQPENFRNKIYVKQLHEYKERLLEFGVRICSITDIVPNTLTDTPFLYKRSLVTNEDIEGWQYKKMVISPKTIVTPLAMDVAKEKEITIERMKGIEWNGSW